MFNYRSVVKRHHDVVVSIGALLLWRSFGSQTARLVINRSHWTPLGDHLARLMDQSPQMDSTGRGAVEGAGFF